MVYGDLNTTTVLETADDWSIEPSATQRLAPLWVIDARAQVPETTNSGEFASSNNRLPSAPGNRKPKEVFDGSPANSKSWWRSDWLLTQHDLDDAHSCATASANEGRHGHCGDFIIHRLWLRCVEQGTRPD